MWRQKACGIQSSCASHACNMTPFDILKEYASDALLHDEPPEKMTIGKLLLYPPKRIASDNLAMLLHNRLDECDCTRLEAIARLLLYLRKYSAIGKAAIVNRDCGTVWDTTGWTTKLHTFLSSVVVSWGYVWEQNPPAKDPQHTATIPKSFVKLALRI